MSQTIADAALAAAFKEYVRGQSRREFPPPMYQVILLNDDVTPADFVVELLIQMFHKNSKDALDIMLEVHEKGRAVAAVCTRQIAESRVFQVRGTARNHNHPLQCTMEQA
jgi:ATP-dependent Clp protease adaptor protein ClpS